MGIMPIRITFRDVELRPTLIQCWRIAFVVYYLGQLQPVSADPKATGQFAVPVAVQDDPHLRGVYSNGTSLL